MFGRVAPVEMEIGVGKGRFLLAAAAGHPDRNWFGLEIEAEYVQIVRLRAERARLLNLRVERIDGKAFVERRLSAGCLAGLHVYFPDPWPKKRHHKRRLVDPAWAGAAARALAPGGTLRLASDHEEYFSLIDGVLSKEPLLEKLCPEEAGDWSTGTSYELKYLKTGRPIHRIVLRRL
ncbi:MAG: tRNA (guanosine(46)-N7)-methyltransferase TrmB [Thermoanaerobaculia bacterium]|nr:tRNA (guanosine(46)-N7)-methyltransferase TrmB [Thermoanaerobaculia bacterium]